MNKTILRSVNSLILALILIFGQEAYANKYPLADLCVSKSLVVHQNDSIFSQFQIGDCVDFFQSGPQAGQYHCQSITKLIPATAGEKLTIHFLQNYIIGLPNDVLISGQLMILNGIVDLSMSSTACTNQIGGGTALGDAQVLFDSEKDGHRFSTLKSTSVTSTAADGGLTIVVFLLSTDLGSFPFNISMAPTPNTSCNLSCIEQVNISLDLNCGRTIMPYDVDPTCTFADGITRYGIMLTYPRPDLRARYGPDSVGVELVGQRLIYKLIDYTTQNSCWGYLLIEDKAPPLVTPFNDTVPCLDAGYADKLIHISTDGCSSVYGVDPKVQFITKRYEDYSCNENQVYTGRILRHYRVFDLWNNTGDYHDTIYIKRLVVNNTTLVCPPDTSMDCSKKVNLGDGEVDILWSELFYTGDDGFQHPYPTKGPDAWGGNNPDECREAFPAPGIRYVHYIRATPTAPIPTIPRDTIVYMTDPDGAGGKCNVVWKYTDLVVPTCGAGYKIRREWNIYDWCASTEYSCIQWIKITDTEQPVVPEDHLANYYDVRCIIDPVGPYTDCEGAISYTDAIGADEKYVMNVTGSTGGFTPNTRYKYVTSPHPLFRDHISNNLKDPEEYYILHHRGEAQVEAHECSAHVTFPDFTEWLAESSCDKEITVFYTVEYNDPSHPGKVVTQHGEVKPGAFIYLPAGWHYVLITFRDDCWNESTYWWTVGVYDQTPPTPVCDQHTVITLDPTNCWARLYAEDLNDGSHDNCCQDLHFAVASMDSITYWTAHWEGVFHDCLGETAYYKHKADGSIDLAINEWINCFVFNDFMDVTGCGDEMVVLRVYEACGAPLYDPHLFKGTKHQWYCWNISDDFACWYAWNYDLYSSHYGATPRPNLFCDYTGNTFSYGWDVPYGVDHNSFDCVINSIDEFPSLHTPYRNAVACTFEDDACDGDKGLYQNWTGRVSSEDRALLRGLKIYNRYWFKHLWNDCMVEINKQDKVAPICTAPEDVTLYCDGVPYWGFIKVGLDSVEFHGADDAWQFCLVSDVNINSCQLDNSTTQAFVLPQGTQGEYAWCYKAGPITDKYGLWQGFYGAATAHGDEVTCSFYDPKPGGDQWGSGYYKPLYCRLWLLLDQYDDSTLAKIDPVDYFADDDDIIVQECSGYDLDHTDEGSLNECGIGTITRTWEVIEKCEPGRRTYCYQRVHVKGRSDFEVCFPVDQVVDCANVADLSPEGVAGTPSISDDDCELIGVNYEDQEFTLVVGEEGTCRKILRTWTIIDWCVYNPDAVFHAPDVVINDREVAGPDRECVLRCLKDDGDGYMTYQQIIKIIDGADPVVTCNVLEDGQVTGGTGGSGTSGTECERVTITRDLGQAEDACSTTLKYRWAIEGTEQRGAGQTMTATLPLGTYTVTLYASDGCGNEGSCTTTLRVVESKAPTPFCYNGIATVIMPSTNEVTVWAKDLDAGSFDNCPGDLRFTFSDINPEDDPAYDEAQQSSSLTFNCDSLGLRTVQVYVWDEQGNHDFCETSLMIQPGVAACPDQGLAILEGQIKTEGSETVEFVQVKVTGGNQPGVEFNTKVDGKFIFSGLGLNQTYELNTLRDDDIINGISTLDLVEMQKHILGLQPLSSPYKMIAADIDRSESISAVDLVQLRKIVLGVVDTFANNTSWRFVPADIVMNVSSPYDFPEPVKIPNMAEKHTVQDFVGVKIGDLNLTSKANSNQLNDVQIRESAPLVFQVEEQWLEAGQNLVIDFLAKDYLSVQGFQFTLEGLDFVNVKAGSLKLDEQHTAWPKLTKTLLTASWNDAQANAVTDGSVLFSISAVATQSGRLSDFLRLSSRVTSIEAYRSGNTESIVLHFVKDGQVLAQHGFAMLQNTPNPFDQETKIGFVLPSTSSALIRIMDLNGKLLKLVSGEFSQGYNEIKIKREELGPPGVLYYQLESGVYTTTRKMILID